MLPDSCEQRHQIFTSTAHTLVFPPLHRKISTCLLRLQMCHQEKPSSSCPPGAGNHPNASCARVRCVQSIDCVLRVALVPSPQPVLPILGSTRLESTQSSPSGAQAVKRSPLWPQANLKAYRREY